jgi:hypothetical protein
MRFLMISIINSWHLCAFTALGADLGLSGVLGRITGRLFNRRTYRFAISAAVADARPPAL